MADFRLVARHVRYWRGAIQKWSTVYPLTGSISSSDYGAVIAALKVLEQGVCYGGNLAANGGLYEIALYDQATGGVPVAVTTYFPEGTPGSWVAYTGAAWTLSSSLGIIPEAETALQVEWPAGLSKSGKPVIFRKWYHSVPYVLAAGPAVNVAPADVAAIQAFIQAQMSVIGGLGLLLGNSSRLAAMTPRVLAYYGNHQMPRGRRRPKADASSSSEAFAQILEIAENQANKQADS